MQSVVQAVARSWSIPPVQHFRFKQVVFVAFLRSLILQHLMIDTDKIARSDIDLRKIVGIIAGFGTTFAAFPDFLAMLKRRSSLGMNPQMGTIMGAFQILWGLLRPAHPFTTGNYLECHCCFH